MPMPLTEDRLQLLRRLIGAFENLRCNPVGCGEPELFDVITAPVLLIDKELGKPLSLVTGVQQVLHDDLLLRQ